MGWTKRRFSPDVYVKSLAHLDFTKLFLAGFRMILLDIDNTLAQHGSVYGTPYSFEQVARIHEAGLACTIISNARTKRAQTFAESLGIPYVPSAQKPSTKGIRQVLKRDLSLTESQMIIIGDQLLTDILAGNRAGILTILVDPVSEIEARQVKIKRPLEKMLKRMFKIHYKDYSEGH